MSELDLKSLTKKERKEHVKALRQKEASSGKLMTNLTKILIALAAVVAVVGLIFVFTRPAAEKPKIGQEIAEQGRNHITQGSTEHEPYNSNPPTSGPHWPNPAECKIYTQEVPDEAVLHSLEHGAGWLSYKDKGDKELVKNLTNLVEKNSGKLVLSPRSKNDSAIAVASWGRLLKLESFDEQQISDFISANKNNSPEPSASC